MQVFLTGATGYIGRAVASRLAARGHSVIAQARSDGAAAKLRERGIEAHRGDLNDRASIEEAVSRADAVIHTVASPSFLGSEAAVESTTQTFIEMLAGTRKPFIVTTGLGVYGQHIRGAVDESTPFEAPPHMAWRRRLEEQVLASVERGVRAVVLRPAFVYGEAGHQIVRGQIECAREKGGAIYIGDGRNLLPFVHVDDLAEAYAQALENAPAGALINVVGSHVTAKDLASGISYAAGTGGKAEPVAEQDAPTAFGTAMFLFGVDMFVSNLRATQILNWTPKGPSVLYDLLYS